MMKQTEWFTGKIIKGKGIAKTLGFPTLNLDNPEVLRGKKEGVYIAKTQISDKSYSGLLYFGPRYVFGEKRNILEIFLFDFDQQIYGARIKFQLVKFLRETIKFGNLTALKKQIMKDSSEAKKILLK